MSQRISGSKIGGRATQQASGAEVKQTIEKSEILGDASQMQDNAPDKVDVAGFGSARGRWGVIALIVIVGLIVAGRYLLK
jgi:hypothetical protein